MTAAQQLIRRIGSATLYLGDCREILPALVGIDAVIGDPPYGQRHKTNIMEAGGRRTYGATLPHQSQKHQRTLNGTMRGSGLVTVWPDRIEGDDKPFDPAHLVSSAPRVLLWGAHRFADRLPPGTWLIWDKVPTGKVRDQGDGEAAWINDDPPRPMRIYRLLWDGVCVGSAARHEVTAGQKRVHPTQKPEALMAWCIEQLRLKPPSTILDPYMGSGSTGVAALRAGHKFIGIETEPLYFETALRRITEIQRQGDMLIQPQVEPHDLCEASPKSQLKAP